MTATHGSQHPLREVATVFLRLGFTAFGGPAAHIAMMRGELVTRRQWVSEARFVELFGVANLIPGPTSTELGLYLGYVRAGWPGLVVAGVCFISPAMLIVLALAWAYVTFGTLPQVGWLFYGIQPVVVAIVGQAVWNLGRTVIKGPWPVLAALAVAALYLLGVNVLALLFGAALLYGLATLVGKRLRPAPKVAPAMLPPAVAAAKFGWLGLLGAAAAVPFSQWLLFLTFLKIGAVIYGSGYVLLAFLRADLVQNLSWLTDRQLLDAVSVGQFTPGPVFTTATFIGYVLGSWPGALLATLGIFLPSFILIPLVHPLAARLRQWPLTAPLLDGANVAAIALMAGVLTQLAQNALTDWLTWALALGALALLLRFKPNSAWLIALGALVGLARFGLVAVIGLR